MPSGVLQLWQDHSMPYEMKIVPVEKLSVDTQNPRHAPADSPHSAIELLIDKMPRKITNLAKDIVEYGLDPSSLIIAVKDGENFVALEGNRRVAALSLIADPYLVPLEPRELKAFEAMNQSEFAPTEVQCVVFDEREEANHWLELRHTGENDGVGIVRWGSTESQRFRRQRGSQTDVAIQFAEAMRELFPDENEFLRDVDTVEADVPTNLGRIIQNPERKRRFGFEARSGELFLLHDPATLLPLLRRLFADLANGVETATTLRDRAHLQDYVDSIIRDEPGFGPRFRDPVGVAAWDLSSPDDDESDGDEDEDDQDKDEGEDSPDDPTPPRRRKRKKAETCLFQGIKLKHVDLRVNDVLAEAQRLPIDRHPNLTAIMIRILLDLTTHNFYEHIGRSNAENTEFKQRVKNCITKIDPKNEDTNLDRARQFIGSNGALSTKTINGYVHGWTSAPLTTDIRALSAAYGPLIRRLDEYMGENPKS